MIDPSLVRIAFYEAVGEPRIMLFGPTTTNFRLLQDCFRRLSREELVIDLHEMPFVYVSGNVWLRLQSIGQIAWSERQGVFPGLRRLKKDTPAFRCGRTFQEWDDLAELIDPLVHSDEPGHQYLTRYPDEDAIVVVSKSEYDDSVIAEQPGRLFAPLCFSNLSPHLDGSVVDIEFSTAR